MALCEYFEVGDKATEFLPMFFKVALLLLASFTLGGCPNGNTVRKEVNDLTDAEWTIFTETIVKASTTVDVDYLDKSYSIWAAAADFHFKNAARVHFNGNFFPWHRLFLRNMETKLQKINPNFIWPYWDSSLVWSNADTSIIWQKIGYNNAAGTSAVKGNIFNVSFTDYETTNITRPLSRTFATNNFGLCPRREMFDILYNQSIAAGANLAYANWTTAMEIQHGSVHLNTGVGSQMNSQYTPYDPLFYLHHAHMDFLWSQAQSGWQIAFGSSSQIGGLDMAKNPLTEKTLLPGYSNPIIDALDISNLCYGYKLEVEGLKLLPQTVTAAPVSAPATSIASIETLPTGSTTSPAGPVTTSAPPMDTKLTPADSLQCPKPLSEMWLGMAGPQFVEKARALNLALLRLCDEIAANLANGISPDPMPNYQNHERPQICESADVDVRKNSDYRLGNGVSPPDDSQSLPESNNVSDYSQSLPQSQSYSQSLPASSDFENRPSSTDSKSLPAISNPDQSLPAATSAPYATGAPTGYDGSDAYSHSDDAVSPILSKAYTLFDTNPFYMLVVAGLTMLAMMG